MKKSITVAALLALLAFSIDFRSKHHYKKENIMSTTPKKPHKHAEIIKAWADGKAIQYYDASWLDCHDPIWDEDTEYRIKPEPAAPVYPETNATDQELIDISKVAIGRRDHDIQPKHFTTQMLHSMRDLTNYGIRRAIDDGQVVPLDPSLHDVQKKLMELSRCEREADRKRLELAEKALVEAGYERVDIAGNWRKSGYYTLDGLSIEQWQSRCTKAEKDLARAARALLNAGFVDNGAQEWKPPVSKAARTLIDLGYMLQDGDWKPDPDFQEVKTTAQQNEEFAKAVQKRLEHAERVLKANGFTYDEGVGWSIHSGQISDDVRDAVNSVAEYKEKAAKAKEAADTANSRAYKAEQQLQEMDQFGFQCGRAVADYLRRTDIYDNQIAAIVLLERAK